MGVHAVLFGRFVEGDEEGRLVPVDPVLLSGEPLRRGEEVPAEDRLARPGMPPHPRPTGSSRCFPPDTYTTYTSTVEIETADYRFLSSDVEASYGEFWSGSQTKLM